MLFDAWSPLLLNRVLFGGLLSGLLLIATGSYAFADLRGGKESATQDELRCEAEWRSQAESGIQAAKEKDRARALSRLRPVVEANPGCYLENYGTASYWLGEMLGREGKHDRQLKTWEAGLNALEESGRGTDARLADAFIQLVFHRERTSAHGRAVQAYYTLLSAAGSEGPRWQARPIAQHLRLVAGVVPHSLRREYGLSRELPADSVSVLSEELGAALVSWWRMQDPLPRTIENERVEEHLQRVAHARVEYAKEDRVDDRGLVYVRLGAPHRRTTIQFNSTEFTEHVLSVRSRVTTSDFNPGKFWVYDQISRSTEFLFVEERRGVFKMGDVISMLPSSARRSFSSSSRGNRDAEIFLRSMKEAYSQLAVYSDRYHSQHQEFANYVMDLDAGAGPAYPGRNRSARSAARHMLPQVKQETRYQRERREAVTSSSYSQRNQTSSSLPVAVRHTRFLEPDGDTRVETSWSIGSSDLRPSEEQGDGVYFLGTTMVQRGMDGRRRSYKHRSNRFRVDGLRETGFIEPQILELRMDTARALRVDLQWDQFGANQTDNPRPQEHVARAVQIDTVEALGPDTSALQVSDLQPVLVPREDRKAGSWENELPYPFDAITLESPLALYFEVYHLSLGSDDRTRYTVEYKVQEQGGALSEIEDWGTAVESEASGTSRTAEEYILLDLQDWDVDREKITIAVQVTDENTGSRVVRELDFRIRSKAEE